MTPESCSVELSPVIMDNSNSFKVHTEGNILLPELAETRGDLTKGYHQFDTCVEDSDMKFVKGTFIVCQFNAPFNTNGIPKDLNYRIELQKIRKQRILK